MPNTAATIIAELALVTTVVALDSPEVATRVFGTLAVDPGVLINCVAASAACACIIAAMRNR